MNDKINGRTPEEIKKGLEIVNEHCFKVECSSSTCPYYKECAPRTGMMREVPAQLVRDNIALINQLQEDKKQLEAAQPKWVCVEERLPEDDVNVLVYIASKKENVDSVIAITHYTHSMHGFNIEGWCSPWQYCFWDREVTHWMPLPQAPKEDV